MQQWMPLIILFILLWSIQDRRRKSYIITQVLKKKNNKEKTIIMFEMAQKFIGKDVIITAFDNVHEYVGTIKEVQKGAILLDAKNREQVINLDFVISIKDAQKKK